MYQRVYLDDGAHSGSVFTETNPAAGREVSNSSSDWDQETGPGGEVPSCQRDQKTLIKTPAEVGSTTPRFSELLVRVHHGFQLLVQVRVVRSPEHGRDHLHPLHG